MASNLIVTSPAASVCRTSVLPSDFTTVPVIRSPFFNVTWSANRAEDNPRSATRKNASSLRNTTYLQISEFVGMQVQLGTGSTLETGILTNRTKERSRNSGMERQ